MMCCNRDVSDNNLNGNVSFLSSLRKLESLSLEWNNFSGELPDVSGAHNLRDLFVPLVHLNEEHEKHKHDNGFTGCWVITGS